MKPKFNLKMTMGATFCCRCPVTLLWNSWPRHKQSTLTDSFEHDLTTSVGFLHLFIPREARRAEGPPSVARFINLSRGDRARIAKGGQISICRYIYFDGVRTVA